MFARRTDRKRALKIRERIIQLAAIHQESAQIRQRHIVAFGHGPERFAISPVSCLIPSAPRKCGNDNYGEANAQRPTSNAQRRIQTSALDVRCSTFSVRRSQNLCNGPCQHQIEADVRQIGVAISVTLQSDLQDPNYREEHDQIPKPANEQIRPRFSQSENNPGDCDQHARRERNLPEGQVVVGMRIEHREIDWPENLPDVSDVSHERVLKAPRERQLADR